MLLQQEIQRHWVRELGRAPEAAVCPIKAGGKITNRFFKDGSINSAALLRIKSQRGLLQFDAAAVEIAELAGSLLHFLAPVAVVVADALEQRGKAGHAVAILGRK